MKPLFLGLDIGGTKCAALIGDCNGAVFERIEWSSDAGRGPEPMIADLIAHAQNLLGRHPGVVSVGVPVGGPMDALHGIVFSTPNLPGWNSVPLKAILEEKLKLPVFVEHDAAACALAEYFWGRFGNCHTLVYLTCGTGFGAGIIIDGQIYRGANGHSIEIGHARFAETGPVAFGKMGSNEAYCSGTGIGLLAAWKYPARWKNPTAKEIAAHAAKGDSDAIEILDLNARAVGQVCANLADLLFPDVILLGSLALHLGQTWVRRVLQQFKAEAHPSAHALCRMEPATLGPKLQDLSALVVAAQGAQ